MPEHQDGLAPLIETYWAKAKPPEGAGQGWHPFLWHSLDVAACAEAILDQHTVLAERLRRRGNGADIKPLVTALALIHDLGKLSRFQEKAAPPIAPDRARTPSARPRTRTAPRHTDIGLILWYTTCCDAVELPRRPRRALKALLPAVFGHHGEPANADDNALVTLCDQETTGPDRAAARTFVIWALTGFIGDLDTVIAPIKDKEAEELGPLSFLLAAVVNIADWLGSNTDWFPYEAPDQDARSYWHNVARPRAARAVKASGIVPRAPTPRTCFAELFPGKSPRPLQARANTLPLPKGQGLVLIEDVTGSGKTEAADVLVARMAAAGLGRGAYIALPTTATATRMAERHAETVARLFDDDAEAARAASLTLVHSGPGPSGVLDTAGGGARRDDPDHGEPDAINGGVEEARAWMSADRRRQLSADVAVGTVDQALLASLPTRFASARIFGLAPKILVVDEVHAHDAYTGELLCGLLTLHAALGGSAILLSATLTADLKNKLANAFAEGAGWTVTNREALETEAYPAITTLDADRARAEPVAAHAGAFRRTPVTTSDDSDAVIAHLREVAGAGGCALWMRNTVDDAIAAYDQLRAVHGDVTLLHARFPAGRRAMLENDIAARFGPESRPAQRAGAIVVATQVLEQSLDLDFDGMVLDLKPMDALIQSAGRLQRHARHADGTPRRDKGGDERAPATLWIHGPAFTDDPAEDWYSRMFRRAAYVYPHVGWLWRTAQLLQTHGEIRQPEMLRDLIEGALITGDPDLPAALEPLALEAEGDALADRGTGRGHSFKMVPGYSRSEGQWSDDSRVPTRLGESVELCLVRAGTSGDWHPWADNGGYAEGFLRVRANLMTGMQEALANAPEVLRLQKAERSLRWRLPLPMAWDDDAEAWIYAGPMGDAKVTVQYDPDRGLLIRRDTGG
jgi:CRISPR-associated endonuclease/helicase Cas3